jgi:hypothetical protein
MGTEHWWNDTDRGNEGAGENPIPVLLCPPHMSQGLVSEHTRLSAVKGQRLVASATTHKTPRGLRVQVAARLTLCFMQARNLLCRYFLSVLQTP